MLPLSAQEQPNRAQPNPPAGASAAVDPVPPVSRHLTSFPSSFFPFLLPLLSLAGAAVERVRPCGHVRCRGWSPRVGSSIAPSNPPTTAYIKGCHGRLPPNPRRLGNSSPIPPLLTSAEWSRGAERGRAATVKPEPSAGRELDLLVTARRLS
jgi:hypothetical protein